MHYWADYYILEILDPDTLEAVPEGEVGEMVVTTLRKEAVPLIRYRTRDLTALKPGPCPCGRLLPRHDRILGRSDDMFIVRAVNIYPGQIDSVLSNIEGIGSEYQVIIERSQGKDTMILKVERARGADAGSDAQTAAVVKEMLRNKVLVTPEVAIVDYASLPRSERKTRRVFDNREEGLIGCEV
jgi:phenylacetate-CoA ligase